jgi:hypothetical protein
MVPVECRRMPRLTRVWRLGPSTIHGIGVFATRDVPPGARLGRIHAEPLGHVQSFTSLPTTGIIAMVSAEPTILAVLAGFPYWYLNYSSKSNVIVSGTSTIVASRLILQGEELTMPFVSLDKPGHFLVTADEY